MYTIEKRKSENFFVYSIVFWGMMSFFYHFVLLTGGGFGPFLDSIKFPVLGVLFFLFLFLLKGNTILNWNEINNSIAVVWTLCSITYIVLDAQWFTFYGVLDDILTMTFILMFLLLREDLKLRIFDTFINVMAILLMLSMVEFLIHMFTGFRYIVFDNLIYLDKRPMVQTLFNLMYPENQYEFGALFGFSRFQSLADEPGGVGTIMGFLLFATIGHPKYKWQYIIFWMAGLLSFSLAFYIMAFVHLIVSSVNKNNWVSLLFFIAIAFFAYSLFKDVFNNLIIDRISDNDISEIDNRTTEQLNRNLAKSFQDGTILFGHKHVVESGLRGALYNKGLIAVLALVLCYSHAFLSMIRSLKIKNSWFALMFFVVFWMSYYQRTYILMFQYVIPFFCMPVMLKYKESFVYRGKK